MVVGPKRPVLGHVPLAAATHPDLLAETSPEETTMPLLKEDSAVIVEKEDMAVVVVAEAAATVLGETNQRTMWTTSGPRPSEGGLRPVLRMLLLLGTLTVLPEASTALPEAAASIVLLTAAPLCPPAQALAGAEEAMPLPAGSTKEERPGGSSMALPAGAGTSTEAVAAEEVEEAADTLEAVAAMTTRSSMILALPISLDQVAVEEAEVVVVAEGSVAMPATSASSARTAAVGTKGMTQADTPDHCPLPPEDLWTLTAKLRWWRACWVKCG